MPSDKIHTGNGKIERFRETGSLDHSYEGPLPNTGLLNPWWELP